MAAMIKTDFGSVQAPRAQGVICLLLLAWVRPDVPSCWRGFGSLSIMVKTAFGSTRVQRDHGIPMGAPKLLRCLIMLAWCRCNMSLAIMIKTEFSSVQAQRAHKSLDVSSCWRESSWKTRAAKRTVKNAFKLSPKEVERRSTVFRVPF